MDINNLSDVIYVVKLGDNYYSSTDIIIDDWAGVRPWLQGVDGVGQEIDLDSRTTNTESISIYMVDKDNYFRDLLITSTLKNLTLTVYATIEGETIGNSVTLFDGYVDKWSGLSVLEIQGRSRLSLLDQYPWPEKSYLSITCTAATGGGKTDDETHPATVTIDRGEGSIPAYMTLSLADGTSYQLEISSSTTIGGLAYNINNNCGGHFSSSTILTSARLATELYWRSYDLSSEYNGTYLYGAVDILGQRIELTGHPYDIMSDILTSYKDGGLDYPSANLDANSFDSDYDNNMRRKWWFSRTLNEQMTARELLESLCESTACYIAEIDGKLTRIIYQGYIPVVDSGITTINDDMIDYKSLEMDWKPETLVNQVVINYNMVDSQSNSTFTYDDTDSQTEQGEIALLTIDSPWINDNVPAGQYPGSIVVNWLAHEICAWQNKPVIEISLEANFQALEIYVGQYILLTFGRGSTAGWSEKRCLVIEKAITDEGVSLKLADTERVKWAVIADNSLRGVSYDSGSEEEKKYAVLRTTTSEEGATYIA